MTSIMSSAGINDKKEVSSSAPTLDKAGWYHFEVKSVKIDLETMNQQGKTVTPHVLLTLGVLATAPGQSPVGCLHYHRINVAGQGGGPLHDSILKANLAFLLTCGVIEWREKGDQCELVDTETGSTDFDTTTFIRLRGRQFVARVDHEPAEGQYKERWNIPFSRSYRVDDPAVADKPRNMQAYELAKSLGFGSPASGSNGFKKQPPQAPTDAPEGF